MTFVELVAKQTGAIVSVDATREEKESIELRVYQQGKSEDDLDSTFILVKLTDEEASSLMVSLGAAIQFAKFGGGM